MTQPNQYSEEDRALAEECFIEMCRRGSKKQDVLEIILETVVKRKNDQLEETKMKGILVGAGLTTARELALQVWELQNLLAKAIITIGIETDTHNYPNTLGGLMDTASYWDENDLQEAHALVRSLELGKKE